MAGNWKSNLGERTAGAKASTGESLTDRYRRLADELRAKKEYESERDITRQPGESTIPKPWEGITETAKAFGINLGELWQTREGELTQARQATSTMEKELHELRLREIDRRVEELQKLAASADKNIHDAGNQGERRNPMYDAIDTLIADRLSSIIGGNNQQQLTAEDIKQIADKAVQEGTQSQQTPQQIMDNLMGFITAAETAKKRMVETWGGGQANGNPYLNQAGSMRSDVLKILLENDRETLRLNHEYETQKQRNTHLGGLVSTVKDNIEDIVLASRDMVKEHRESRKDTPQENNEEGYKVKCSLCNQDSIFTEKPTGIFECPKCHGQLRLQDPPQSPKSSVEF